ncbi:MAG: rhomboid family protein [Weeksellaceae bacterium]|nr:rhomboid family protein [Weeksellaceae bacterium]
MTVIIILLGLIVIGYFAFQSKKVKNMFGSENKYYTLDDEFNAKRKDRQDEIDKLLSKIGKNGVDALTEKERKRLDELSQK